MEGSCTNRCGQPTCHCAKPNDPGHAPQFRLTRKVAGKTITESFPNPAGLRKAQQEVAEFHRFQELSEELVATNERICALRPVEQQGGWAAQRKKRLLFSIGRWRGKSIPEQSRLSFFCTMRRLAVPGKRCILPVPLAHEN